MDTKKDNKELKILEPVFDTSILGILDLPQSIEAIQVGPVTASLFGVSAPTTNHYSELSAEMLYYNNRGQNLLYYLFYYSFCMTQVNTALTVTGAWEAAIQEQASYKVTVYNTTYFDLTGLRVILSVINGTGKAEIVGDTSKTIGNLAYNANSSVTFSVKAKQAGTVTLAVSLEGYIGCLKLKLTTNGSYWNGTSWAYRPSYRNQFTIV